MRKYSKYILIFALSALTLSCNKQNGPSDYPVPDGGPILVGGVDANLTVQVSSPTKANDPVTQDAETVDWLVNPLKHGLDITYGLVGQENTTSKVAILKLLEGTEVNYSFKYLGESDSDPLKDKQAIWYNNGFHFFQGMYVPGAIRYSSPATGANVTDFTSDQSKSDTPSQESNYTLLMHYLAVPANTRLYATVERIKIPLRHRLAHVKAYILIDPSLNAHIEGYADVDAGDGFRDDPSTSAIRFGNVQVLGGVREEGGALIPTWVTERQVIPHFFEQRSSMTVYESKKEVVYETSDNYSSVASLYASDPSGSGYVKTDYRNVPCYDIIVRPTYSSVDNVMYDEEGYGDNTTRTAIAKLKNKIDFEISLDNGLVYEKTFEFDLDANYETAVYLRITREQVDYNDSGSDQWVDVPSTDGWYGVDNENGNYLSKVGGSWQRSYRIGTSTEPVTDGHYYGKDIEGDGQYMAEADWIRHFAQAYRGGADHGNYFILSRDISIDARQLPDDFVFTGHLDAFDPDDRQYHTITLTNLSAWDEYVEAQASEYDTAEHLYEDQAGTVEFTVPSGLYSKLSDDSYASASPSKSEFMSGTYYTRSGDTEPYVYTVCSKPGHLYKFVSHPAKSALFAGLDGKYATAQESDPSLPRSQWEANVYNQRGVWVPYKDDTSGWRAEVMNLKVSGGKLFEDGALVTGNVQNCKENGSSAVADVTPSIPVFR